MPSTERNLTVAVTGPTGTFGFGFVPLLESDPRVERVVGIARRVFDPSSHGWTKMQYRRGDVRDQAGLEEAFEAADVVVHLAFLVAGAGSKEARDAINIGGTINAFRAAVAAGARRFVYASSVAAYGFHPDNPIGMTEEWPTRPAMHMSYAQEKAEVERLLLAEAERNPSVVLYLLRPSIVLGPHTMGAKEFVPAPIARLAGAGARLLRSLPMAVLVPTPELPMQFVHEADVGQALLCCTTGTGAPGAYNIAGDGVVTTADVVREAGFCPVHVAESVVRWGARSISALPTLPIVGSSIEWAEAATHPAIMDTTKAKRDLGWRPEYTTLDALRTTLR